MNYKYVLFWTKKHWSWSHNHIAHKHTCLNTCLALTEIAAFYFKDGMRISSPCPDQISEIIQLLCKPNAARAACVRYCIRALINTLQRKMQMCLCTATTRILKINHFTSGFSDMSCTTHLEKRSTFSVSGSRVNWARLIIMIALWP